MSLIHKALKKTEEKDPSVDMNTPDIPAEEFVGSKKGFMSPEITPTTIFLIVILVVAVVYVGYTKFFKNKIAIKSTSAVSLTQTNIPKPQIPADPLSNAQTPSSGTEVSGTREEDLPLEFRKITAVAKDLFANGKLEEALVKFKEAEQILPGEPTLLNNIGLLYKKMDKLDEAENYYKKALEKNPNYAECLNNLGTLKVAQNATLDAALYFKKAIGLKPSYADPYFNLAVLMENEGNYKSAIDDYKLFLKYAVDVDSKLLEQVKGRIEELTK